MRKLVWLLALAACLLRPAMAADNLRLNQHLDYFSDSHDGPLITGDHLDDGVVPGRPAYILIYGEGCYNAVARCSLLWSFWTSGARRRRTNW